MRLTRKLAIGVVFGILLVLISNAILRFRREASVFENDIRRDDRVLGRAIAGAVARVWDAGGEPLARAIVDDANHRESQILIRWVWPDAGPGDPLRPHEDPERLRALAEDQVVVARVLRPTDNAMAIYTYVPVPIPGPRRPAIELSESLAEERAYLKHTILQSVLATSLLVAICGAIVIGFGSLLVGRPVRQLVAQAKRIGAGDFSHRLAFRQRDELGELAKETNAMCEKLEEARRRVEQESRARLEALEQLRLADRLTTVGKLAAGVAHELGTPLNVVLGETQLVQATLPPSSAAHDSCSLVCEQARRMTSIIQQLLDFARRRPLQKMPVNPGELCAETVRLLEAISSRNRVSWSVAADEVDAVEADRFGLQQVLTNLMINAIQAMPEGGRGQIEVSRPVARGADGKTRECLRITVTDEGQGIDEHDLEHIFEPFFTRKPVGEGTGLGLSVAHGIVQEHGGWIDVQSSPSGSSFMVYVPV